MRKCYKIWLIIQDDHPMILLSRAFIQIYLKTMQLQAAVSKAVLVIVDSHDPDKIAVIWDYCVS